MNKTTAIAIISFFIIGVLVGSQLHGCKGSHGSTGDMTVISRDTLIKWVPRTDTIWRTIPLTNNVPYTVWGHDTVLVHTSEKIIGHDTTYTSSYQQLSDTVAYSDTLRQANEFKAIIMDTLTGNRIIGRSLRWADVSPIEVHNVTIKMLKKSPLVKLYVGADAYGGKTGSKINIDLAPAASLVFADRYMLDLGYYIFNQQVTAGFKVKISVKQR